MPALVVYLLFVRSRPGTLAGGAVLVLLLTCQWWSSATDGHSTASLGPAVVGWFLIPASLVICEGLVKLAAWGQKSELPCHRLAVLGALALPGVLLTGPTLVLVGGAAILLMVPRHPDNARNDPAR